MIGSVVYMDVSVWPPYPGVVLRRGMQGPSIVQVQERLNELGAQPRLAADGIFGPLTEAAVTAFQRVSGLTAEGCGILKPKNRMPEVVYGLSRHDFRHPALD
jgi:peptidoglycan hydrolase-like protein with peptidoglycan-binding domain